jgi:hypothetical protein
VSLLGLGLIITVMVGFMLTRSLSVAGILLAVAAVVFTPLAVTRGGRTGWELVLLRIQFAAARARGEHIYRAGRFAKIPGIAKLPGLLADSRLAEYETPGGKRFAMLHIRRSDHYTVVLRVVPRGKELVDQDRIDAWVEGYGQFLAAQSRGGEVVAVTAVLENVVETRLKQAREVARLVRPDAPEYAQAVMREAAADTGGVGVRIEARIAPSVEAASAVMSPSRPARSGNACRACCPSWRVQGFRRHRCRRGKYWVWCAPATTLPPSATWKPPGPRSPPPNPGTVWDRSPMSTGGTITCTTGRGRSPGRWTPPHAGP